MNGTLIPNTPIAVDFWQTRRCSHVRLFFLSHMHSDHTMGLSSTWKHPLYCSPVTAKILKHQLQVSNKWINPLEVGQCHMLPMDDTGIETVAVTLIDANHCPGSVMFLFEGYFGTILYTGDFRYTPRMLNDLPLRNKKIIDVLYLDNTNCDPGHKLPSRQDATNQIKEIIDRHPEHDIVIGLYSIGKESLLVDLAKTFKSWIVVRPLRLELLRILEMENVFVAEEGAGRFRIVEQSEVNYANMMQWNRVYPTLAILPTSRRAKVWHKDIHVVPYSDHSSFDELIEFVAGLEPCSIIPVVKTQVCEVHFQQYLSSRKKPQTCVKIPASVRAYMKRQESTGKTGTERLFKATFPKHVPRGVEFESPEKRPDSTIGFGSLKDNQKSSPNSLDIESINLQKHDMGDSFLNVKRRSRAHMPLTESTVLMSTKSPCSHMTDESDDDILEMPSRIFWSPKDDNMTAISETSPLSPEATSIVSHDIPDKKVSLFFKCTNMEWKGEDSEKCSVSAGLSIVPWKKQGNSGPQNFHSQVERYFKELHSADGQN